MNDVIVFASISVDGYAAGADDDLTRLHRWMTEREATRATRGDPFVAAFRGAGVVVFGRRTYGRGQEPWGDDEVFDAPVVVVTTKPPPLSKNGATFTFTGGPAAAILDTARGLARLVVYPLVLGTGKKLFSDGFPLTRLALTETRTLPSGVLVNTIGVLVNTYRRSDAR